MEDVKTFESSKWHSVDLRTFSGTIRVDPSGDESCNLVEITRVKFMQSQGASDLPPAISYLSVSEIISLLVLSSGSES